MSVEAITWALKQTVDRSSTKFVLVVMANCASPVDGTCFPSSKYLAEATSQDRKTVLENLGRLIELGFITDTGNRMGATKQVPVYRVNHVEQYQNRNSTENGTVPFFPGNSTVFPAKQSRKRDTDTKGKRQLNQTKGEAPQVELPSWIKPDTWADFTAMRKTIKKPLTAQAVTRMLNKLHTMHAEGHDIEACLNQSILNNWQDVFPMRQQQGLPLQQQPTAKPSLNPEDWGAATAAEMAAKAGMQPWSPGGSMGSFEGYKRLIASRLQDHVTH